MTPKTKNCQLDSELTLCDRSESPLTVRTVTLALTKQVNKISECHLTFQVSPVVQHHPMGDSVDKILAGFPGLTMAQFYDALSYYYDRQVEIDADKLSHLAQRFNLPVGADGTLSPQEQ